MPQPIRTYMPARTLFTWLAYVMRLDELGLLFSLSSSPRCICASLHCAHRIVFIHCKSPSAVSLLGGDVSHGSCHDLFLKISPQAFLITPSTDAFFAAPSRHPFFTAPTGAQILWSEGQFSISSRGDCQEKECVETHKMRA
jgi:hypothetical protein